MRRKTDWRKIGFVIALVVFISSLVGTNLFTVISPHFDIEKIYRKATPEYISAEFSVPLKDYGDDIAIEITGNVEQWTTPSEVSRYDLSEKEECMCWRDEGCKCHIWPVDMLLRGYKTFCKVTLEDGTSAPCRIVPDRWGDSSLVVIKEEYGNQEVNVKFAIYKEGYEEEALSSIEEYAQPQQTEEYTQTEETTGVNQTEQSSTTPQIAQTVESKDLLHKIGSLISVVSGLITLILGASLLIKRG